MPRLRPAPAYLVPSVAILALAAFLAFALVRLFQVEQDMRGNVDENMLWVVTQAQVASHRLDQAVNRRALGDLSEDPELRLDILASRLSLMDDGPQRRYLVAEGLEAPLDDALAHLRALRESVDDAQGDTGFRPVALYPHLDGVMSHLNRIANAVMMAEWESTGTRLDTYHRSLMQVIASVAGITLSGLGLILLLFHALRQRRAAQRALTRHRDYLEEEVARRTRDLEAERRRVVTAIDTAPDGFAAFDAEGSLRLTNPKLAELLPLDPRWLSPGSRLEEMMVAVSRLGLRDATPPPAADTPPLQYDLQLSPSEWRQLILLPAQDGGQVLRVSDISRYMQAADALSQALERERGVSEFYRSFAAMVSHQFRTPLAVIDSGLQRLQRRHRTFSPQQRSERYQRLREAVAQMTRLLESALTAARLDGGQVEASPAACDLAGLAEQVGRLQEEARGERRIVIETPHSPLLAWCDRGLVEQVLANLLSNALKYSAEEETVRVRLGQADDRVFCRVEDRGMGIAPDELPRLFERFFRSRQASGIPGTGLGLNIARHLARIQGGEVTVDSVQGKGTTFTLWLPAATGRILDADSS